MVIEEDQDQRENDHAEDLEHDPGVVDERDDPHAENAQEGRAEEDDGGHVALSVEVGADAHAHVVQQRNEDERDGGHYRSDCEHPSKQVDPAGEPGVGSVGQVLGPLVDRSGDREVRADLGEVEADEQLADHDDGPAPEEGGTGQADAQDEKGEDAGRRRDVREGDREAGVDPQHPPQLLLIPEPREVLNVSVMRMVLQVLPLPRLAPPRNVCYRTWGEAITRCALRQRARLTQRANPPGRGTSFTPLSPTLPPERGEEDFTSGLLGGPPWHRRGPPGISRRTRRPRRGPWPRSRRSRPAGRLS